MITLEPRERLLDFSSSKLWYVLGCFCERLLIFAQLHMRSTTDGLIYCNVWRMVQLNTYHQVSPSNAVCIISWPLSLGAHLLTCSRPFSFFVQSCVLFHVYLPTRAIS
jgi:hypothetical protein